MGSIRNLTPVSSKIFIHSWKGIDTTEFYETRHFSLRPLVIHVRDGGIFEVMDYGRLREWYDIYLTIIKINENFPIACDRLSNIFQLQNSLNADYLFVDSNGNDILSCDSQSKLIFNSNNYYLFQTPPSKN